MLHSINVNYILGGKITDQLITPVILWPMKCVENEQKLTLIELSLYIHISHCLFSAIYFTESEWMVSVFTCLN